MSPEWEERDQNEEWDLVYGILSLLHKFPRTRSEALIILGLWGWGTKNVSSSDKHGYAQKRDWIIEAWRNSLFLSFLLDTSLIS